MNIAVVFEGDLQSGGGYQQQLSSIKEIYKLGKYKFKVFVFTEENKNSFEKIGFDVVKVRKNAFSRIQDFVLRSELLLPLQYKFKLKNNFEKTLDKHGIDLVYFLSPSELSLNLISHNYIMTVWDLCHRDHFEFPEVGFYRIYEWREILYTKSLPKAVAVICDSNYGKENIVRRYGVDEERVVVSPFLPSENMNFACMVDIKRKYEIIGDYIYYPAQFWAHKNHVYIIDALKILHDQGQEVYAIFSGSDKGNLKNVLNYANLLGIGKFIKYIGFAPNEEIASLYKSALALVMPTYFGPTNIPPLEAFAVGCPVIYSDLRGLRDQVGDAALLCNLNESEDLAMHISLLIDDQEMKTSLIQKGFKKLEKIKAISLCEELVNIIEKYEVKLKCFYHH